MTLDEAYELDTDDPVEFRDADGGRGWIRPNGYRSMIREIGAEAALEFARSSIFEKPN